MTDQEIAQEIRHIAEKLAGGGSIVDAVDELHDLAERVFPGSGAELDAYIIKDSEDDNLTDGCET